MKIKTNISTNFPLQIALNLNPLRHDSHDESSKYTISFFLWMKLTERFSSG
jgi:hypothetical protein